MERVRAHLLQSTGNAVAESAFDDVPNDPTTDTVTKMEFILQSWHKLRDRASHFASREDIMNELQ